MENTGNIVKLNIGGVLYTTTNTTLCKYPDSILGAMFSGTIDLTKDENGCYFIDRDGKMFEYIINYLRTSELALPKDFKGLKQLRLEASFYQLRQLVEIIDGLLVPKQLEYFFIEHNKTWGEINYIIQGKPELIKKYFPTLINPKQLINAPSYFTLKFRTTEAYDPMKYGEVLLQDGWKLAGSNSTCKDQHGSTVITSYRDTWSLEK